MSTLELGFEPGTVVVKVTFGADFVAGFDLDDEVNDGTVIALVFNDTDGTVWPATIDSTAVDWNVDKADVAALVSRLPDRPTARLTYTDGTTELGWMLGGFEFYGDWTP